MKDNRPMGVPWQTADRLLDPGFDIQEEAVEGGCDYLPPSPPDDATSCVGYRLLQALLDCKALTGEQVRAIVSGNK